MSKRVLFVDDEPNILQALQRMFRSVRSEWDMAFAGGGGEALALMAEKPYDVVVSDMRMPHMDGAQLLNEIKRLYPNTIRIILSGHADRQMIMDALGATHQYLSKPCDAGILKAAIERAFGLNNLFEEDPSFKPLIARIHTLPSIPSLYLELTTELRSPDADANLVAQIIARDPAMTAKTLQLVNSAFFGLTEPIADLGKAVNLLGLDMVRSLVLSAHVFKQFNDDSATGVNLGALWQHGSIVGSFARQIARLEGADDATINDAAMAGTLHDIGKLILLTNMAEEYLRLIEMAERENADLFELERMYFGATHAEIGAYLLGLWGLPDAIVEAVGNHHHLGEEAVGSKMSALVAVHVANALAHELVDAGQPAEEVVNIEALGQRWVGRLPVWRAHCAENLHPKTHGPGPVPAADQEPGPAALSANNVSKGCGRLTP